uniref:Uncharacterized protein n=1 Tax=Glossina pallidipes TaxID=7398 RepID=A0A1A9ZEV3_GLOPL
MGPNKAKKSKAPPVALAAQRVCLYMQPQAILYPIPEDENTYIEIELEHAKCVIAQLRDHCTPENKIHLRTFEEEKPTFSVTIDKDSYDDIEAFSDAPLKLTLYEHYIPELSFSEGAIIQPPHRQMEDRWAVAQGYIDMMQFFIKWRYKKNIDVLLYPIRPSRKSSTCKMSWDIYALTPIVKNLTCSNAIFITFMSLQNVEESLLDDCDDLVAALSLQSKEPIEDSSEYRKVFICKYTAFAKKLVSGTTTGCQWESLKDPIIQNYDCIGINSDIKLNLFRTIFKLFVPEDCEFSFPDIEADVDYNLVCNSMHRYVLTDSMHRQLEQHVAKDDLHLIVEIFRESNPTNVLLQGFIDLAIFMYPKVNNCSFAVKMTPPPNYQRESSTIQTMSLVPSSLTNVTPVFAIIRICIKTPLTEPSRDFFASEMTDTIYNTCWQTKVPKEALGASDESYEKNYRDFDNTVYELVDCIISNNLYNTKDRNYLYGQICNVANRVLPLLTCDFNIRYPTTTSIEFANLMTTVYDELVKRVHHLLTKDNEMRNTTTVDMQENMIFRMNLAKLMHEVDNYDMCDYLFDQLEEDYGSASLFRFYKFIFDIELENYESARKYLQLPYLKRDIGGELFTEDLNSEEETADEKLLIALNEFCETTQTKSQVGWILLFCVYKRHKYRPGMEYSRWNYEKRFKNIMPKIKYMPRSRWIMLNGFTPNLTSPKGQYFWSAIEVLLQLGLYEFAAWIFDEIADECLDVEKYIIKTSFIYHLRRANEDFVTRQFPGEKIRNGENPSGHLEKSKEFFIQATNYGMYFPDVWAYLAVINLRLGEHLKALECWKYARLNPNTAFDKKTRPIEPLANECNRVVFLYLQPKNISYPDEDDVSVDILLEHAGNAISKLSDCSALDLVIRKCTFASEKPTFSISIKQDAIEDIISFSDTPIVLTAYEYCSEEGMEEESVEESGQEKTLQGKLVAQGYLDMLQFFTKKRCNSSIDVFLYPLDPSDYNRTYKITLDVYSLLPLIKDVQFSNIIYLSFKSLFNVEAHLLDNCDNLVAKLSWQSKVPNAKNKYEKEFICKYTVFTKTVPCDQNLYYTWESLKTSNFKKDQSMGVASALTLSLHHLFDNILRTEDVDFDFDSIDMNKDYALVCNSIHRFILTDRMHVALEKALVDDKYKIIIEMINETKPSEIVLQGFIDPSIFLYPEVTNCSFAVAMKPPPRVTPPTAAAKNLKTRNDVREEQQEIVPEVQEKTTFALIKICLKAPITEPADDLLDIYNVIAMKRDIFKNCWLKRPCKPLCSRSLEKKCAYSYKAFDDAVLELIKFITAHNICSINDDKHFHCEQVRDMADRILPLISFDFNVRQPTNTNMEFTLERTWGNNDMFLFYKFIYDLELKNYDAAEEYLRNPIYDENLELIIDICELYLNYIRSTIDTSFEGDIEETLLVGLMHFCEIMHPKFPVGWMLLYCVYKRHTYRPGMDYARWHYENLVKLPFIEIDNLPTSRWEIFNDFEPTLRTEKAKYFWEAITCLLKLGLYIFAQWLYEDIAEQLPTIERYILDASFKLATNQVEDFHIVETLQVDSPMNAADLLAFVDLVNGNIEYLRSPNNLSWVHNYASIFNVGKLEDISPFHLGILRYACYMLREKEFETAIYAFDFADDIPEIIRCIGKAKAFYHLGRLGEAEQQLAISTTYNIYYPSVWANLALINLRLGKNYEALECWKYARLRDKIDNTRRPRRTSACLLVPFYLAFMCNDQEGKSDAVVSNKSQTHTTNKIFLYLKQSIIYPEDDVASVLIEVDHPLTVVNKMPDHDTTNNTFRLSEFEIERPTFSVTLEQDGIDDAMAFSSTPLGLTLYECTASRKGEYHGGEIHAHATTQGYLDIMSFFSKKLSFSTITTFVYPLDPYSFPKTCKMTWEIYSLMPLIKDIQFSNVLIISFASLFNIDESLLKICDDLVATLSWRSTFPRTNKYTKIEEDAYLKLIIIIRLGQTYCKISFTTKIMEVLKGDYEFLLLFAERKKSTKRTKKGSRQLKDLEGLSEPLQVVKVFPSKPAKVFLYLQPQNINYERANRVSVFISLEHGINTITKLTDFYQEDNAIDMETFMEEKPTFSLTIKQDDLDDIEKLTSSPMKLILYEKVPSKTNEVDFADRKQEAPVKKAAAYGYVDLMRFFTKRRSHSSLQTFLYPLDVFWASDTCKITWEIYSLMPIMREVNFSNVIFVGLTSLFNIEDTILENCDDLIVELSFQSKDAIEEETYEKIFICKYTAFTKQIISKQNTFYKWENLKDPKLENYESLGVYSDIHFSIDNLFTKLLCTEDVDFNFDDIDMDEDYALVCNSMHRFILTDTMHADLEKHLVCDEHEIIVEIYKESESETILLQGFIDLSLFMYPGVADCAFAVELKPPMTTSLTLSRYSKSWENHKTVQNKNYSNELVNKTIFTIINVCMKLPITDPAEDLNETYNVHQVQCNVFKDCWKRAVKKKVVPLPEKRTCEEIYKSFDDQILWLIRYMVKNNMLPRSDNDNKFFCTQITNTANRILPLIACDFNVRYPTKTNTEFVDLMTIVFRELTERCSGLVQGAIKDLLFEDTLPDSDMRILLIQEMNFAKLLYHIGKTEMSQYLFDMLEKKYDRYALYRFYVFINDLEMGNFELARQYLNRPWQERYDDGISVTKLCEIYLDYMEDVNGGDGEDNVTENLLKALTHFCEDVQPKIPIGWMILYCIYKKHDYRPGMSYARWKYENVMGNLFFEIKYIPKSRWQMFNNFQPKLKTERQTYFWKACELLLQLGLYHFAWLLFEGIADELQEIERYILNTSFQLATNLIQSNFITRSFSSAGKSSDELKAFVCLVNGNIEYYRQPNGSAAMGHYGAILDIKNTSSDSKFQLGVLRYAYRMLEDEEFEEALDAFQFASKSEDDQLIANVGKAKALYFLNHLEEAEQYFAKATRFTIYLPNIWAYLALINLRLGESYKALQCWKYAHLEPDVLIHEEILSELANVDIENISLCIDPKEAHF